MSLELLIERVQFDRDEYKAAGEASNGDCTERLADATDVLYWSEKALANFVINHADALISWERHTSAFDEDIPF